MLGSIRRRVYCNGEYYDISIHYILINGADMVTTTTTKPSSGRYTMLNILEQTSLRFHVPVHGSRKRMVAMMKTVMMRSWLRKLTQTSSVPSRCNTSLSLTATSSALIRLRSTPSSITSILRLWHLWKQMVCAVRRKLIARCQDVIR